jgi:transcriptional regulator
MYVPAFNRMADDDVRAFVEHVGAAELVTVGADGYPRATLLPILWDDDRVVAHMARANEHWQDLVDDVPALLICRGPQAYVSPSWYATKAEHGRVVPTWNYSAVQLRGRVRAVQDDAWLRTAVTLLTDRHEAGRPERWSVTDAPAAYVDGQLRGIVGIDFRVEEVAAKAKLSQNRSAADRAGVVAGLRDETGGDAAVIAEQMAAGLD